MIYDLNSLVPGDIARPDYEQVAGTSGSFLKCDPAFIPITMADGTVIPVTTHLNSNQNAGNQACRAYRVSAPYAGTLVVEWIAAKPSWVAGTSAPAIYITNSTGTTLASTVCTLTSLAQSFSVSTAVTAGTEYQVRVTCYDATLGVFQNSEALCSRIRVYVVPSGTVTGVFAESYIRIPIDPSTAMNVNYTTLADRRCSMNSAARVRFRKSTVQSGTPISCVVEYYSTLNDMEFGAATIAVGNPGARILDAYAQIQPTTQSKVAFSSDITLPLGQCDIEYIQSGQSGATGTFGRAIYVPASADIRVEKTVGLRKLIVVGDSIMTGSTSPASWNSARGMPALMRRMYPGEVVFDAYGGRSAATDGYVVSGGVLSGSAGNISLRQLFVDRIGEQTPSDILVGEGTNDWASGQSAADTTVAYQAMFTDLMFRCPTARLFVLLPIYRTANTAETVANAGGATLPQTRTAITTALTNAVAAVMATAPAGYAVPVRAATIDGRTFTDASYIGPDGIHPIAGTSFYASQLIARNIFNNMGDIFT